MDSFEPGGWSGNLEDLPATGIDHWVWDSGTNKERKLKPDSDLDYLL